MGRGLDPKILTGAFMAAMDDLLAKMANVAPTKEPLVEETGIIEYDGRMRVSGMEKFNDASFVSVVNFALTQADLDRNKAKGAFVLYMQSENISKFLKAFGIRFGDDEDDASVMEACGNMAATLAAEFKVQLAGQGFAELVVSKPSNYKNNVIDGVAYSPDQKTKQTISYFYFKTKAIVVDLSMAEIPRK